MFFVFIFQLIALGKACQLGVISYRTDSISRERITWTKMKALIAAGEKLPRTFADLETGLHRVAEKLYGGYDEVILKTFFVSQPLEEIADKLYQIIFLKNHCPK